MPGDALRIFFTRRGAPICAAFARHPTVQHEDQAERGFACRHRGAGQRQVQRRRAAPLGVVVDEIVAHRAAPALRHRRGTLVGTDGGGRVAHARFQLGADALVGRQAPGQARRTNPFAQRRAVAVAHAQRDHAAHRVQLQVAPAGVLQRPAGGRTGRFERIARLLQFFLHPAAGPLPAFGQDGLLEFAQCVHRRW